MDRLALSKSVGLLSNGQWMDTPSVRRLLIWCLLSSVLCSRSQAEGSCTFKEWRGRTSPDCVEAWGARREGWKQRRHLGAWKCQESLYELSLLDWLLTFFFLPRIWIMLYSLCISSRYPGLGCSHPPIPGLLPLLAQCLADHWAGCSQCRAWPQPAGQPYIPAHQPQWAGRETAGVSGALGKGFTR